jgi:hypothetical protein
VPPSSEPARSPSRGPSSGAGPSNPSPVVHPSRPRHVVSLGSSLADDRCRGRPQVPLPRQRDSGQMVSHRKRWRKVVRPTPPPCHPVPRDLIDRCFNCLRTDHVVAACTHAVCCLRCHGEGHQVHTCKRPWSPDSAGPPPRSEHGIETTTTSLSPAEGTLLPRAPTHRPRLQTCDLRTAAMTLWRRISPMLWLRSLLA